MPIDTKARIDLRRSDPRLMYNINNGPRLEDDFLNYRLGQEYDHYNKLRRDGHLNSKLQKRVQSVLGRRIVIEYPEWAEIEETVKEKSLTFAKILLNKINYEILCNDLIDSGNLLGFAGVKADWKLDPITELLYPSFEFIPQYRFNFAYHDESPTAVQLITDERLSSKVPVRDQIVMSGNYEVRLLTKRQPTVGERVPKGRIIIYSFGSSQGLPGGLGLGYQLYPLIQIKNEARNAWLLHSDRLGSPPVIGTYPFNNEPKDSSAPPNVFDLKNPVHRRIKETFEDYLAAISPNGFGVFPEGFDAKLLENIHSSSPDVHERLIRFCDHQVSETILGEVAYSERQSGGSRAASDTQLEDRDRNLTDSDCNLLDEQLIPFWEYYWGLNAPQEYVRPVIRRWTTEDDRKIQEEENKASGRKSRAEADKTLIDAGFIPSDEYVEENYPGWIYKPKAIPVPLSPSIPSNAGRQQDNGQEAEKEDAIDESEWTKRKRDRLANGEIQGGFAGPLNSYPVHTSKDLDNVFKLSEFSDLKNSVRFNAVNVANRFGLSLPRNLAAWAEDNIQGDFGGVSRYVTWNGYKIGVEYEVGSTRFDKRMKIAYGHFVNHIGADREALDVYLGPHFSSQKLFRITQVDQDGNFDEYKYGILFDSIEQFEKAYKAQMPSKLFGGIEECDQKEIDSHHRLNFLENEKDYGIYAVFWSNRSTATIVNGKDFGDAKLRASRGQLDSFGAIRGVRKFKGNDAIKLRCGAWVRLLNHATNKKTKPWLFTDATPVELISRKMPDPNKKITDDFLEPIILLNNTETMSDKELDDFATDRDSAEKDAKAGWKAIAPSKYRNLLED